MQTVSETADATAPTGDGVVVRGLSRRFGRRWVLANVDFAVPRGRALMITGANGSGKTTLLRCLATALRPHKGTIAILGLDAWNDRERVRPRMALYSHPARLYDDLSAAENLRVWARLGGLPVDVPARLAEVGLPADRVEPVRAFSAGMRRRLSLAIALLKRPDVLLLDEPFAALDPVGRELVATRVRDVRSRGTTVIMATHLPAIAGPLCDEALHLDGGVVAWRGRPEDAPRVVEPDA